MADQQPEIAELIGVVKRLTHVVSQQVEVAERQIVLFESVAEEINSLWSAIAPEGNHKNFQPNLSLLTPKQQEVFQKAQSVAGNDVRDRRLVQSLLRTLAGQSATEPLTSALKHLLRGRGWGIRCTSCDAAARPLWRASSAYAEGGCIQFSHPGPSGRSVVHAGHTTLPKLVVVDLPERRRNKVWPEQKEGDLGKIFAENLRYWRCRRKLSQEELAKRAGLHRPNFVKIENERQVPGLRIIEKLAAALEIPPALLISSTT